MTPLREKIKLNALDHHFALVYLRKVRHETMPVRAFLPIGLLCESFVAWLPGNVRHSFGVEVGRTSRVAPQVPSPTPGDRQGSRTAKRLIVSEEME